MKKIQLRINPCTTNELQAWEQQKLHNTIPHDVLLQQANISLRYRGKSFVDLTMSDELFGYVKLIKHYLQVFPEQKGISGVFTGNCGTGKTLLACIMIESVIKQGYSAQYTTAWNMIQRIREGYQPGNTTGSIIAKYIKPAFLVIDEIGVQHRSEDERILLYQVIDGRYNNLKSTLIISNSADPVHDGYIDLRVIDRLQENGGLTLCFKMQSYRRRKKGRVASKSPSKIKI